jgi:ferredoxin
VSDDPAEQPGLEVVLDQATCMSSGACMMEAPGAFEMDDDDVATVRSPITASEEEILEAARACPVQAITVRRNGVVVE